MKTFVFKLYRNKKGEKYLDNYLSICCEIYNHSLAYKQNLYKTQKINISKNDLQKHLKDLRNSEQYKHWQNVGSQVIQQITDRIYNGYNLFFKAKKEGKKGRHRVNPPKLKKNSCKYKSLTFKQAGFKFLNSEDKNYGLLKIGELNFKYHRSREIEGKIKTLTVKRNSIGEYFIFITTDIIEFINLPRLGKYVGFDFGLGDNYLIGSDGYNVQSPLFFLNDRKKISKLTKKLKSKKEGSNNRERARLILARAYIDIANRRNDFHWKLANSLVDKYDFIFFEDLNLKELMAKVNRRGRKIADLGFYNFILKITYLFRKYCKMVRKIDRYYPSTKTCSNCGFINNSLTLKDREWECPDCKVVHDRDYNAAINILKQGLNSDIVGASTIDINNTVSLSLGEAGIYDVRIPRL